MGALPKHRAWSPHEGGHSDFFRNTFKEPRSIATQQTTSYKAGMLHPAQGSREVTPSSDNEEPSNVATHGAKEGIKGGKKRCK
jgi:hypothetical protein